MDGTDSLKNALFRRGKCLYINVCLKYAKWKTERKECGSNPLKYSYKDYFQVTNLMYTSFIL